ncbi:MAG: hypothetical protein ACOC6B_00600 [Thermodesulfobacteriota bacterium]
MLLGILAAKILATSITLGSGNSGGVSELFTRILESSHDHFFVVGADNRIYGHISLETLRPILRDYETVRDAVIASDLMDHNVPVVKTEESLEMVMQQVSYRLIPLAGVISSADRAMK